MAVSGTEVRFRVDVGPVPDTHLEDAQRKAQEAFVLALLRHGDISAGRAAELLAVDRAELAEVMSAHGVSPFDDTRTREDLEREVAVAARAAERQP